MSAATRRPKGVKAKRPQYTVLIQQSDMQLVGINSLNGEVYQVTFGRHGPFKSYHAAQSFVASMMDKSLLYIIEKVAP